MQYCMRYYKNGKQYGTCYSKQGKKVGCNIACGTIKMASNMAHAIPSKRKKKLDAILNAVLYTMQAIFQWPRKNVGCTCSWNASASCIPLLAKREAILQPTKFIPCCAIMRHVGVAYLLGVCAKCTTTVRESHLLKA